MEGILYSSLGEVRVRGRFTAHPPEDVKVPAGTFRAIRVEAEHTANAKPCPKWTYWFAAGVGLVKQVREDTSAELKSFTPGKE